MLKKFLFYLSLYIGILFIVFRNIFFHLSTNLLDWRDYAFYVWMMFQNVTHIVNLDFTNFFETNAFFPHKLTLFFIDTMLPQSIIFLPFYYLTKNLILAFNLTFIVTFVLNFIALFLFWRRIFKRELIAFLGSLLIIFSPFFHTQLGYFTVMSFWPFFFGLFFLFDGSRKKSYLLAGLFLSIQFLASIYIGIFMIVTILIFFAAEYLFKKNSIGKNHLTLGFIIIFAVFAATSGIFIKGYLDMKKVYNAKRDIREYIGYSGHLSDYFFTTKIDSLFHQSSVMNLWNRFDKNQASHNSFPGFLIFISAILVMFKLSKDNQTISIDMEINKEKAFFLVLILIGFLFSLGPRLNFNGYYAHIPLPYYLLLKFIPGMESIRGLVRWNFLFFLGFTYFSLLAFDRLINFKRHQYIFILIFLFFILEYLPFNIQTTKLSYLTNDHKILREICSKRKKVLLELPATHLNAGTNIREGLQYLTANVELASTYHSCLLVNGYSGYDLPENFVLADTLNKYIEEQNVEEFIRELKKRNIDLVKFNQTYFVKELKKPINIFLDNIATKSAVKKIGEDLYSI